MKITRIDVAGSNGTFAALRRRIRGAFIEVEILTPAGTRAHVVSADDRDEQFAAAREVQRTLDGGRGTNSMIHDYYRLIQQLAD